MSEEESVERLRTLGLNLYESRAYLTLLSRKELTAKALGQSALIPQSRTYDVLDSLARKGFALETPASPPAYVPVPPEKILGQYFDSERVKIKERAAKMQEEAQTKLETIREAYTSLTKDFPADPSAVTVDRDRVWVLQKRENIENTLTGYIRDAKAQVLRVTKPPEPRSREPLDPFYIIGLENQKSIDDAVERKVEMRWLSLAREIPTFLGLEITEPPERRYLERESDITEKFFLVDKYAVLLNLHDPLSPSYGYVALAMQSRAVSAIFVDHFEKMWRKAKPLSDVLPRMVAMVDEVGNDIVESGFAKTDALLYRTLANLGAAPQDTFLHTMSKKRVQPQAALASFNRLAKAGLVHRDTTLRLLMVEHPTNALRILSKMKA